MTYIDNTISLINSQRDMHGRMLFADLAPLEQFGKAKPMAQGWECPRCHRIHAPHVNECECSKRARVFPKTPKTTSEDVMIYTITAPTDDWIYNPPMWAESENDHE